MSVMLGLCSDAAVHKLNMPNTVSTSGSPRPTYSAASLSPTTAALSSPLHSQVEEHYPLPTALITDTRKKLPTGGILKGLR